jgi:hypothetical protein
VDIERNARTQVLYREVNERIRSIEDSFGGRESIEVMCECGRGCTDRLEVPIADYERARGESTYFLVAAPHRRSPASRTSQRTATGSKCGSSKRAYRRRAGPCPRAAAVPPRPR